MPSDLLIPLLGGSAFQIAPAIQNGVFAELLFNVEHGFLNFAFPFQFRKISGQWQYTFVRFAAWRTSSLVVVIV